MTKRRIQEWVDEFGLDGVYVSFSGGKDSTVLLTIAREMYGDGMKGVFVDTGLEYPEIRSFVKTWSNIDWIKPKMTFKQVIEKYGYPFISKLVSHKVGCCQKHADSKYMRYFTGEARDSRYNAEKWKFLLDAPFRLESKCCDVIKKEPGARYQKQTGRHPIMGILANESMQRAVQWTLHGCNAFDTTHPSSAPLSFWTEQDVLLYIFLNKIPICSVYGQVVVDNAASGELEGQMSFRDLGGQWELFDTRNPLLKTTECDRTGCMFCGYGCHLQKGEGRFEIMKRTHPKQYEYIMKPWSEGGLGYKEVIDWINEHGGLNIRY